jgi:hypothetical protein
VLDKLENEQSAEFVAAKRAAAQEGQQCCAHKTPPALHETLGKQNMGYAFAHA